jgi:hypothetical protein
LCKLSAVLNAACGGSKTTALVLFGVVSAKMLAAATTATDIHAFESSDRVL